MCEIRCSIRDVRPSQILGALPFLLLAVQPVSVGDLFVRLIVHLVGLLVVSAFGWRFSGWWFKRWRLQVVPCRRGSVRYARLFS